jgi:hypothetical protein
MFAYVIWRIRIWLRYDGFHLTPEMKVKMARTRDRMKAGSWIGVCLLCVGFFIYVREEVRDHYALRAPGKIVRVEVKDNAKGLPLAVRIEGKSSGKRVPVYQPEYQYTLADGRTYQASTGYWSSEFDYQTGDEVTVLYWESDPAGGAIEGINIGTAKLLASAGLLFAIVFRFFANTAMNETLARIQWCLLLKLP